MKKVNISNVPSSNRSDFGYRDINHSHTHNEYQNNALNDIVDLFNKVNNIEKKILENEMYIKEETTYIESEVLQNKSEYKKLLQGLNELLVNDKNRKKIILPSDLKESEGFLSAVIDRKSCAVVPRPVTKVSKLSVLDNISDTIYIPDSLNVFINNLTNEVISETDNDIYAPFNKSDDFYWIRNVASDNTVDYIDTEYIISMPEEIMTSPFMNEVIIHPFMAKVLNVEYRYGDSNSWRNIEGLEYNTLINQDEYTSVGATRINFYPVKANQLKITLRSNNYKESEVDIRNFAFGLKYVGVFLNEYSSSEPSYIQAKVKFDEEKASIIISDVIAEFNNNSIDSKFQQDIQYEFLYKNSNGIYQYISESLPFTIPSNELLINIKIAQQYKEMNISHFCLNYDVIFDEEKILISTIGDFEVDYRNTFDIYYAVRNSNISSARSTLNTKSDTDIIVHEISYNAGKTWEMFTPYFDGVKYKYTHRAIGEIKEYESCYIKVTDFNGVSGQSNKFKISALLLDDKPVIDSPPAKIYTHVGRKTNIVYRAYDDNRITEHQFSKDSGVTWKIISPDETHPTTGVSKYIRFTHIEVFDSVGEYECQIQVTDGISGFIQSTKFIVVVDEVPVEGITVLTDSMTINLGDTVNVDYQIYPVDATNKDVIITSSNEHIVIVNDDNTITGVQSGKSTIKVSTIDKNFYDTCEVYVKIPVTDIELQPDNAIMYIGDTLNLTTIINPVNATNHAVEYRAFNNCISVDTKGTIEALHPGATGVIATSLDSQVTDTCIINVYTPVTHISLNETLVVLNVSETFQLVPFIIPSTAYDKTVTWTSSDNNVVTVDSQGLVTAVGRGNATITCTTNNKNLTATCDFIINTPVTDLILSKDIVTLYRGEKETLQAIILPPDATNKSVIWSSSDINVATIDGDGNIVGISLGTSLITAKSACGGHKDTCLVHVQSRITDIVLNPNSIKVISVDDPSWSKEVSLYLEGFTTENTTEEEEIVIQSKDENIALPIKRSNTEWVTNKTQTIPFDVYGINNGDTTIDVKLKNNRLKRVLRVSSGEPLQGYIFNNVPVDVDGIQRIKIPGGFTRNLTYNVLPSGCIFTLGDAEGKVLTSSKATCNIYFDDQYNAVISHTNGGNISQKEFTSIYECRGFYNKLPNFEVTWTKQLYELELVGSDNISFGRNDTVTIQIKSKIDDSIFQGPASEYNFADTILVSSKNSSAVRLSLVSIKPVDNRTLELKLMPDNITSSIKNNILTIKGACSDNTLSINISMT